MCVCMHACVRMCCLVVSLAGEMWRLCLCIKQEDGMYVTTAAAGL